MDKKNTMLLTVIAVATLLVAVVGATFAYFSVTGETTNATSAVDVSVENVGSVALNGGGDFDLTVTAAQMANLGETKTYGGSAVKVATATLDGGDQGVKYSCSFNLNVDTTNTTMTGLKATDGGVDLTFGPNVTVDPSTGFVAGTAKSPETITAGDYTVNFDITRSGEAAQVVDLITIGATIINDKDDSTQATRLGGGVIDYDFTISAFECDTVE